MRQKLTLMALAVLAIGSANGAQMANVPVGSGTGRASFERHAAPPPRPAQIARPVAPPAMPAQRVAAPATPRPAPPVIVQTPRPPIVNAISPTPRPEVARKESNPVSPPPAAATKPKELPAALPPAPTQPPASAATVQIDSKKGTVTTTETFSDARKAGHVSVTNDMSARMSGVDADLTVARKDKSQLHLGGTVENGTTSRLEGGFRNPRGEQTSVVFRRPQNGGADAQGTWSDPKRSATVGLVTDAQQRLKQLSTGMAIIKKNGTEFGWGASLVNNKVDHLSMGYRREDGTEGRIDVHPNPNGTFDAMGFLTMPLPD